jgi:anti-anti-sigma regulatory factor
MSDRRAGSAAVTGAVELHDLPGGGALVLISGAVDRARAREAEALLRDAIMRPGTGIVAVHVSGVDEINGALLGALVRSTRRMAWRNRSLVIVCEPADFRQRLEIAGLDDLAELRAVGLSSPLSG